MIILCVIYIISKLFLHFHLFVCTFIKSMKSKFDVKYEYDDNQFQDYDKKERSKKHHHKHRSSGKETKSATDLDIWTIVPLTLSFCLFLCSIVLFSKKKSIVFCDEYEVNDYCFPCPENARCVSGKLLCKTGYKNTGRACVRDNQRISKYANIMGKYIASSISDNCNISRMFSYEDLYSKFGNKKDFQDAIDELHNTIYDIHVVNGNYVSYDPILNTKCKVIIFAKNNKSALFTLFSGLFIALVITITLMRKKAIKRMIQEYADMVIEKLKKQTINGARLASDYEPLETNNVFRYWDDVQKIIEMNPNIYVFYNEDNGKTWKYQEEEEENETKKYK